MGKKRYAHYNSPAAKLRKARVRLCKIHFPESQWWQVDKQQLCHALGVTTGKGKKKADRKLQSETILNAAKAIVLANGSRSIEGWANTRLRIYERDNGVCGYCNEPVQVGVFHCDHIHPHSLDGSSEDDNLVTACVSCNLKKSDRVLKSHELISVQEFISNRNTD